MKKVEALQKAGDRVYFVNNPTIDNAPKKSSFDEENCGFQCDSLESSINFLLWH